MQVLSKIGITKGSNSIPVPTDLPVASSPSGTSITMRLARGARTKKEEQYLRQAIPGARATAAKSGAKAGFSYLEAMVGRPLTDKERALYAPLVEEVAPIGNDTEGIYRYLMGIPEVERRGIWNGLNPTMKSQVIGQHPELKMPTEDPVIRRKGVEVKAPQYMVKRTYEYLNDPKFYDKMGPMMGRINAGNPYDTDAQEFRAHLFSSAQVIGKYLEGGVLRDADVPKYEKMLPQMWDTAEVAKAKMHTMESLLEATRQMYLTGARVDSNGNVDLTNVPFNPNAVPLQTIESWLNENGADNPNASEVMQIYEARKQLESMPVEEAP